MMYNDLRTQLEQIGRLPVPEPRPEFTDGLLARLQAVEQISSMTAPAAPVAMRGAHRLRIFTAGAVAAALLSVVGYVSMQGPTEVPITMTSSFGTVEVTRDDDTFVLNPSDETPLKPGDKVFLSGGSEVQIDGKVHEGGEAGRALVINENGDVSTPPLSVEADDPTSSTEATMAESSTTETAEATDTSDAAKQAAVDAEAEAEAEAEAAKQAEAEAAAGPGDAATTTGSSSELPSTTAEVTPATAVVPVPTEPIIVKPKETPIPVQTTLLVDDEEQGAAALTLLKLTTNGQLVTLEWEPYEGDDFGCYLILYTTGDDPETMDSPLYPRGGSSTLVQEGSPLFDQNQGKFEFHVSATHEFVRYRIAATDGPCLSPAGNQPVAYGKLVAISGQVDMRLPQSNPASSVVQHSNNAEFKSVSGHSARS